MTSPSQPWRQTMQITDEMVERACRAFSKAWASYLGGECKAKVTNWFDLDAQDAVDFGVLKEPKWDSHSDIRGMQHELYVAAVVKEPLRAALSAALSVETRVKVKPLEWTAEDNGEFIAVSAVGWYHIGYPARSWNLTMPSGEVPSFGDDLEAAKAAAQADYSARILSALAVEPDHAPQTHLSGLSIAALQSAHIERQEEWCPDQKPDLSFRGNELGGECGEAQNVIKKLERERHGWRGSRDTVEHLAEELADVIHCAILVAITAGIEIEPAVIAKFNSTSDKNGLSTRLATEGKDND